MSENHPTDDELRQPGAALLAVLGSPIAHSKSPAIHAAAYEVLGLPWSYGREELEVPALEGFLAALGDDWRGLSLTMPLKEEAARLAAVTDPVAAESGVVNTLLKLANGPAGAPQWAGFNTDVAGLARAIQRAGLDASSTVVLGAGATAVSAVLAARSLGAERVAVAARRPEAAEDIAQRFGGDVSGMTLGDEPGFTPTLIISTLPGHAGDAAPVPATFLAVPLFDVAYDPWPSPLALRWDAAGGVAHAGLDMLVEQALVQIRIFVNGDPDVPVADEESVLAAMRAASVER
ncbi:shikimate dehydrogenase family protein [Leucobacter komagatae]|uniref:shikimate dehydrogenase family protein n=1 Tax=Leucobacter komagatae TaxID=55969 RepID=UPI0005AC12C9|nr:shikimate dehydrogenase [Leucobacter komagatae]